MVIDPSAVTIQDRREIAPTFAMLVGSMMIPEPIMFTATMNVSCTSVIFFVVRPSSSLVTVAGPLIPDRVDVEVDAVIDSLLVDALHSAVEPGNTLERRPETRCASPPPQCFLREVDDPVATGALRGPLP